MEKPDLYVVARLLEALYDSGRPLKTNVQILVGLNYPRFTLYLEWFQSHDLVQTVVNEEGEGIVLSAEGLDSSTGWSSGFGR